GQPGGLLGDVETLRDRAAGQVVAGGGLGGLDDAAAGAGGPGGDRAEPGRGDGGAGGGGGQGGGGRWRAGGAGVAGHGGVGVGEGLGRQGGEIKGQPGGRLVDRETLCNIRRRVIGAVAGLVGGDGTAACTCDVHGVAADRALIQCADGE